MLNSKNTESKVSNETIEDRLDKAKKYLKEQEQIYIKKSDKYKNLSGRIEQVKNVLLDPELSAKDRESYQEELEVLTKLQNDTTQINAITQKVSEITRKLSEIEQVKETLTNIKRKKQQAEDYRNDIIKLSHNADILENQYQNELEQIDNYIDELGFKKGSGTHEL